MSDTSSVPPFDQFGGAAAADQFPTSGATTADDTLYGVTKALGVVPVAVRFKDVPAGAMGPPSLDIQPLESVVAQFDHLDAANRAKLQQNLLAAGYYPQSYYGANPPILVPGENDPASRAAWRNAVEDAARASTYDKGQLTGPKTVQQVITERIANRQTQGVGAGGVKKPQQITQLTNPDDIRRAVVDEARATLGHKVDEATINDIISRYQQKQAEAQQTSGPVVTQAPSLTTFASQQVQASNPEDAAAHRGLGVGNLIMNAFMSSAGNAPTGGSGG